MKQLTKEILTCFTLLISLTSFSQERKILGRILDSETQKPIQNVNVSIAGTTLTTSSNRLGFFELTIDSSKHKALVASHIGFKTSTIEVPTEDRFKFALEKEHIRLSRLNLNDYPRGEADVKSDQAPTITNGKAHINESNATYPNGIANFYQFMGNALARCAVLADEHGFNITFTINEIGQASNISLPETTDSVKSIVLKVFEKMPAWSAATQGQVKVPQHFVLPVFRSNIESVESQSMINLYSHLSENIKYPVQALRMGIQGVVFVEFQVDKLGSTMDVRTIKDIGAGCGEEVNKAIRELPEFLSQELCRYTNSTKFLLPVCFGLEGPFMALGYTPASDGYLLDQAHIVAISRERDMGMAGFTGSFVKSKADTSFFYYKDGTLKTKGRYVGPNRFGVWTNYYESGKIKDKVVFDGDFIAAIECYDEAGNPKMIKGTGEWETKYFDAMIRSEVTVKGSYKDTLRHGTWNYYEKSILIEKETDRLVCTETYKEGKFVKGKYYWRGGGIEDLKSPVYVILPTSTVFKPFDKKYWEDTPVRNTLNQEFDREQFPQFPGGTGKFFDYVHREFRCSASQRGPDKKVYVEFAVDSTGHIERESIRFIKGDIGEVCSERLRKVLENSPKWKPARQLGKYVSFKMVLPINFQ